jgi:hypothetical protein
VGNSILASILLGEEIPQSLKSYWQLWLILILVLMFSTGLCLVSHAIAQWLVTAMMMLAIAVFFLQQKHSWYCLAIHLNIFKLHYLFSMETLLLVENIRQNWLGQEPTSVITVSNYWTISWLIRHILVESIKQN